MAADTAEYASNLQTDAFVPLSSLLVLRNSTVQHIFSVFESPKVIHMIRRNLNCIKPARKRSSKFLSISRSIVIRHRKDHIIFQSINRRIVDIDIHSIINFSLGNNIHVTNDFVRNRKIFFLLLWVMPVGIFS